MWMSVKDTNGRQAMVNMALATKVSVWNDDCTSITFDHDNMTVIAEPFDAFKRRLAEVVDVDA